ncbi:hypothetical protein [uncultured Chryseobacterium sp.]|nr:hypothetical protein [uncultured Chryseobacterium sp.]
MKAGVMMGNDIFQTNMDFIFTGLSTAPVCLQINPVFEAHRK